VISAFHEILLNAIEHGAHFDPSQYVEVAFVRASRMMLCRVRDPGVGFYSGGDPSYRCRLTLGPL